MKDAGWIAAAAGARLDQAAEGAPERVVIGSSSDTFIWPEAITSASSSAKPRASLCGKSWKASLPIIWELEMPNAASAASLIST